METKHKTIWVADSSGLVSLAIQDDSNHKMALVMASHFRTLDHVFIIPEDVFSETINILGKKHSHEAAYRVAKQLLFTARFQIASASDITRSHALKLFLELSHNVSYTDCLVMATANTFKTTNIFGFDEIFRKRGFTLPSQ